MDINTRQLETSELKLRNGVVMVNGNQKIGNTFAG